MNQLDFDNYKFDALDYNRASTYTKLEAIANNIAICKLNGLYVRVEPSPVVQHFDFEDYCFEIGAFAKDFENI